jgi:hypothetical protein
MICDLKILKLKLTKMLNETFIILSLNLFYLGWFHIWARVRPLLSASYSFLNLKPSEWTQASELFISVIFLSNQLSTKPKHHQ